MGRPAPVPAVASDPLMIRRSREQAVRTVVEVLLANRHRVLSRRELARRSGVADLNERRCDSLLVDVRRALGAGSVVTVRSRGWMLAPEAIPHAESFVALRHDTPPR